MNAKRLVNHQTTSQCAQVLNYLQSGKRIAEYSMEIKK